MEARHVNAGCRLLHIGRLHPVLGPKRHRASGRSRGPLEDDPAQGAVVGSSEVEAGDLEHLGTNPRGELVVVRKQLGEGPLDVTVEPNKDDGTVGVCWSVQVSRLTLARRC